MGAEIYCIVFPLSGDKVAALAASAPRLASAPVGASPSWQQLVLFWSLAGFSFWCVEGIGASSSDSVVFRAASMVNFAGVSTSCCGCLGQLFYLWVHLLQMESFEGARKEWLLWLLSSSFRASPSCFCGHI